MSELMYESSKQVFVHNPGNLASVWGAKPGKKWRKKR